MTTEKRISLRTLESEYYIDPDAPLQEIAQIWAQTLGSRNTWNRLFGIRQKLANESRYSLKQLCPDLADEAAIEQLASSGLIEIQFPSPECGANAAWDIPWEFLLSSATEENRLRSLLLVNRHLRSDAPGRNLGSAPNTFLVVKTNPGYLRNVYTDKSLTREEKNMKAYLGLDTVQSIHNETLESIQKRIEHDEPDVIHVAGVDGAQAAKQKPNSLLIEIPKEEALMMPAEKGGICAATALQVAPVACSGRSKPLFVGLNFVNSGSRFAPHLVLHGAGAALGFLNGFDDILAETFFANLYLAWRLSRWNLLDAFRLAWSEMSSPDPVQLWGTGVVLWSRESLLDGERARLSPRDRRSSPASPPDDLRRNFDAEREKPIPESEQRNVLVVAKPLAQINYSLLHNNRNLFEYFYVRKPQCIGTLSRLSVDVSLQTGTESMTYHTTTDLNSSVRVLHDEVRVPLTSTLARSIKEIIHTALTVKVDWNGRNLLDKSFRVSLLPIDQWQNDDLNRKWLPSFILPRDPSIIRIVDSAQSYLMSVADNAECGFDGYQSGREESVRAQVQAIWWALINNLPLAYVNPLPVYTASSQRLRSPSAILGGRRGTCLDLALLMAACLEYIDLYSILFLVQDHAL